MKDKRIAVIGIPGKWSTEVIADALEQRTGFRCVLDIKNIVADLATHTLTAITAEQESLALNTLDGIVIKKINAEYSPGTLDRLELLRMADSQGVRVFSPVRNVIALINRLSCTMTLHNHNIPMPATVITEQAEAAFDAVKRFNGAVFKPLFSTKARGMAFIEADQSDHAIQDQIRAFQADNAVMYIQQKLHLPGQDLGMVFMGGEYLCTYARVGNSDTWNTTIHSGGRYAPFKPSADLIELGRKAQAPFGMDFTTVDIAETEQGPVVFEVSAFGGFKGALDGAGINAADRYADYILKELQP